MRLGKEESLCWRKCSKVREGISKTSCDLFLEVLPWLSCSLFSIFLISPSCVLSTYYFLIPVLSESKSKVVPTVCLNWIRYWPLGDKLWFHTDFVMVKLIHLHTVEAASWLLGNYPWVFIMRDNRIWIWRPKWPLMAFLVDTEFWPF